MYSLKFSENVVKDIEKLPKDIRDRIYKKLLIAKENPFRYFVRLVGKEDYKLRVGDYRIIARIFEEDKLILVGYVGHRKNIYDKNWLWFF